MYHERKENLSVYYYIKDLFSDVPSVNIVDAFPTSTLELPTLSVRASNIEIIPWELGNEEGLFARAWFIDVFAQNLTQRDEMTYRILHALERNIPVYDYDEGFPPSVSPSRVGALITEDIKARPIDVLPDLVDKMYYRTSISFTAAYDKL
jgi:hypothetical protein